jgi:hypothetical protein
MSQEKFSIGILFGALSVTFEDIERFEYWPNRRMRINGESLVVLSDAPTALWYMTPTTERDGAARSLDLSNPADLPWGEQA